MSIFMPYCDEPEKPKAKCPCKQRNIIVKNNNPYATNTNVAAQFGLKAQSRVISNEIVPVNVVAFNDTNGAVALEENGKIIVSGAGIYKIEYTATIYNIGSSAIPATFALSVNGVIDFFSFSYASVSADNYLTLGNQTILNATQVLPAYVYLQNAAISDSTVIYANIIVTKIS